MTHASGKTTTARHAATTRSGPPVRGERSSGPATRLVRVTAALTTAAALVGLLADGVYTGAASTAEMLRGYDLVTAVVVGPGLLAASVPARRGSVLAELVTAGLLAYVVYTYAYYLFGTGFNDLFLLHVAVFATALGALVLVLGTTDVTAVGDLFGGGTATRAIAGILAVLGLGLGGMWVYFAIDNAVTGDVPAGSQLVETVTMVRLGMTLDLAVLVPLYAAAAALLWRRAAWGYLLAAVALFAGLLHQVSYLVAMPFQAAAGIPGAVSYDPLEPVIVLLYLTEVLLLLLGARARPHASRSPA